MISNDPKLPYPPPGKAEDPVPLSWLRAFIERFYRMWDELFHSLNEINESVTDITTVGAGYGRNLLDNGEFRIAQRGASMALTTTMSFGCLDRWQFKQDTTAAGSANQVTGTGTGFKNGLKLQRSLGATSEGIIRAVQNLESLDSIPLVGQTLTLSFWAVAGANYSPTGSGLGVAILRGTGTDQTGDPGSWTGTAIIAGGSGASEKTITTTLTRYEISGVVTAGTTQIGIQFYMYPIGTAGADDSVTIEGVQLEIGDKASPFDHRSYSVDFERCARFLPFFGGDAAVSPIGMGYLASTTAARIVVPLITPTRAAVTGITVVTVGSFQLFDPTSRTCSALTFDQAGTRAMTLITTHAAGAAAGPAYLRSAASNAYFYCTGAEL